MGKMVSLSGFMGCGKSTIGRLLHERMNNYELVDLDTFIETAEGRTIPWIFENLGEKAFREMETKALEAIFLSYSSDLILSLGGGTLTDERSAALVRAHTLNIYLKASEEYLVENLLLSGSSSRPLLQGTPDESALRTRVHQLLLMREATYIACADHIITLDGKDYAQIRDAVAALIPPPRMNCSPR